MSDVKPAICFVTNELYPLGPGGIGRMLYNFARHNEAMGNPADLHFLVPPELLEKRPDARNLIADALGDAAYLHICPAPGQVPNAMAQLVEHALHSPWTLEGLIRTSYSYYLGLLEAERTLGRPFDIIEFPDFGGWAVSSIEAKRTNLAFERTTIAARVHSTQGILYKVERFTHHPGSFLGIMFDAERHLLAHADIVVGHNSAIMDVTAAHYALAERWKGRAHIEFPPVFLDEDVGNINPIKQTIQENSNSVDFIFSSRLQPFKRPDIFIRAAILFLEENSGYEGVFRVVSYGWDSEYINHLQSLVPDPLKEKIQFIFDASPAERDAYLRRSVVVIPSDYESLCLFAFEAAQMERTVILNGRCPAFGKSERWRDGENCLLFDGTVENLCAAMKRSMNWTASTPVDVIPDRPYWLREELKSLLSSPTAVSEDPGISVICHGFQSRAEFNSHFATAVHLERLLSL